MKRALITGGACRIGREIALHLARSGYEIILHYNTSSVAALQTYADICNISNKRHDLICADLENNWQQLLEYKEETLLINNASIFCDDNKPHSPETIMTVNYIVPSLLSEVFAELGGAAINLLDAQSIYESPNSYQSYHSSKLKLAASTSSFAEKKLMVFGLILGATLYKSGQNKRVFDKVRKSFSSDVVDVIEGIDYLLNLKQCGAILDLTNYMQNSHHGN